MPATTHENEQPIEQPEQKKQRRSRKKEAGPAPRRSTLVAYELKDFKRALKKHDYKLSSLQGVRAALAREEPSVENDKKVAAVESAMRSLIKKSEPTIKRRVPGTGTAVTIEKTYADTLDNRRRNRVGQKYTVTTYEDAEYTEVDASFRRKRRRAQNLDEDGNPVKKAPSKWILAMTAAKDELGAKPFTIVRKSLPENPSEDDKMGKAVYDRAMQLMEASKEQR